MVRPLSLLVCLLAALGSPAAPLYQDDFDTEPLRWQSYRPDAVAVQQNNTAKAGSALETTYELLLKHQIHAVGAQLDTTLAGARRVCLSLRSSRPGAFLVALSEADGSRYDAVFWSPGNAWLDLQISLDRFRLSDDSSDENHRLDPDQVNTIGVGDLSALLTTSDRPDAGERTFWLDDVSIDTDEALTAYSANGRLPYLLDGFQTPYLSWLATDGDLSLDQTLHQMVWGYSGAKPQHGFSALYGPVGQLPQQGATHLLLTLQSDRAAQLVVVLQESKREAAKQDESRYLTLLNVPGGQQPGTYAIKLGDLTLSTDDGGSDENGKLDLDQVGALILADLDVMMGNGTPNTLRLDAIELAGE